MIRVKWIRVGDNERKGGGGKGKRKMLLEFLLVYPSKSYVALPLLYSCAVPFRRLGLVLLAPFAIGEAEGEIHLGVCVAEFRGDGVVAL